MILKEGQAVRVEYAGTYEQFSWPLLATADGTILDVDGTTITLYAIDRTVTYRMDYITGNLAYIGARLVLTGPPQLDRALRGRA